jgi:hypothetical protein
LNLLNDLLISKIRKVTLATLVASGLKTDLWATRDILDNWVVVCRTCVMAWPNEDIDHDSVKLDKLITDGLEQIEMERFESGWFNAVVPDISKIVKADRMPLVTTLGVVFEYTRGWSKKVEKKRAYYRPEYLQLAQDIVGKRDMKYSVYLGGTSVDGREQVWLLIYEGRRPFMVVSNVVEIADAEENACSTG